MKELFGQRLREQRIKHGLTLEQLAEKSELSSNYIGMVERGLKEPGLATIVKLLNAPVPEQMKYASHLMQVLNDPESITG